MRPSTVFAHGRRTPSRRTSQNWNVERPALAVRPLPRRGALRRREGHASAAQRRGEPGRLRPRRHGAERRPPAHLRQLSRPTAAPATSRPSRCCATSRSSTYHAGQVSVSRRFAAGVGFNVSYWFSKSIDYLSAMNLSGAAAKPLAGENDLAQNPFDLEAEYGPSLFDARHRFVASASWEPHVAGRRRRGGARRVRRLAAERHRRRTTRARRSRCRIRPTSRCRPTARRSPGSPPAGPNLIGDPNAGPHTVDAWISRDAFQRLESADAGRAVRQRRPQHRARPGYTNVDVSLVRDFTLSATTRACSSAPRSFNVAQPRRTSACRWPT